MSITPRFRKNYSISILHLVQTIALDTTKRTLNTKNFNKNIPRFENKCITKYIFIKAGKEKVDKKSLLRIMKSKDLT